MRLVMKTFEFLKGQGMYLAIMIFLSIVLPSLWDTA